MPADLRVLEARGLAVQEAILTGESVPVENGVTPVAADAPLGDRRSMLWSGTLVTQGTARGLVVAKAAGTEIGRIGGLLAGVEQLTTPLVAQMEHLARWLSFLTLLASGLLLAWGYFVGHQNFSELFMTVVAITVSAIPEGLPACGGIQSVRSGQGRGQKRNSGEACDDRRIAQRLCRNARAGTGVR